MTFLLWVLGVKKGGGKKVQPENKGEDRNMDKLLWDIIAVSTLVITMEDFFSSFLRKKIKKWKYVSIWLFFFFFHMTVMKKMDGYLENILGNLIALSIICWFAYQEIFAIKEMMIFLAISLSAISEGIVAAILIIIKGNINGNTMLYSIISKIIFWCIIRILSILYKGKIETVRKKSYGIFLTVAVVANSSLLLGILKVTEETSGGMLQKLFIFIAFVLLISDISAFKLYVMYQEQSEMRRLKQEYANQLIMYDKHLSEKQMVIDEVRRVKHDMKNNMIYLQNLLKANPEEAEKYLEKFIGKTTKKTDEFSKSGNFSIDSMLNYKNMIAKSKGLSLILEEQIPINLPYENSDLCVILGNLLDNAIEATENSENKEIDVRIVYAKNKLKITVKNYYTGKIKKDTGGNFISTKSDTKNHGIGLQSVTRIVEAYGGVMEVLTERSVFQVNILM